MVLRCICDQVIAADYCLAMYAGIDVQDSNMVIKELKIIWESYAEEINLGLWVNAGHGLNYQNVYPIAILLGMEELNSGHSKIIRAVLVGIDRAIREMELAILGG
jgi:pyridoxine 5-phosphate synthase